MPGTDLVRIWTRPGGNTSGYRSLARDTGRPPRATKQNASYLAMLSTSRTAPCSADDALASIVHVLIQLGVCLQLLFKSPIEQAISATCLRPRYAMSGTDTAYGATSLYSQPPGHGGQIRYLLARCALY
eukprot:2585501-Rhodomonas_salina.4